MEGTTSNKVKTLMTKTETKYLHIPTNNEYAHLSSGLYENTSTGIRYHIPDVVVVLGNDWKKVEPERIPLKVKLTETGFSCSYQLTTNRNLSDEEIKAIESLLNSPSDKEYTREELIKIVEDHYEVYLKAGYANHFGRFFKETFKCNPKEILKRESNNIN